MKKGRKTDRDQLPLALVRAGLLSVGIEPSDERIASTLAELTELPDEEVPLPLAVNPPKLGVADLARTGFESTRMTRIGRSG